MKRPFQYFAGFCLLTVLIARVIFSGCASSPANLKHKHECALQAIRQVFRTGDLFRIFESQMAEQEALTCLYAYMPTIDLVGKAGEFYLADVRAALQAREELPWGSTIPDREWRHFVSPLRVNNEALDSFRTTLCAEPKVRHPHLGLHDAALEVNHWCHEHVACRPSDARTASPLATMRTATVGAVRSRRCWWPRWAHVSLSLCSTLAGLMPQPLAQCSCARRFSGIRRI